MFIEFVGSPGSGKSFWAKKVITYCHEHNIKIISADEVRKRTIESVPKVLRVLRIFCYFFNITTIRLFFTTIKLRKTKFRIKKKIMLWYLKAKLDYEIAEKQADGFVFFEEGLIQRSISCYVSESNAFTKFQANFLKKTYASKYKVVFFDLDEKKCIERIRGRKLIDRFIDKTELQQEKIISNFRASYKFYFNNSNITFYTFNNSENIEDSITEEHKIKQLIDFIRN
jgi:adenylate kinase family enzyme